MVRNPFKVDHKKITQIINYFASKAGGKISKLKVLKLIFLADRYHLRKYGRLVSNDNYVAMKLGPVPSTAMDIAEADSFLEPNWKKYVVEYLKTHNSGMRIESIKPTNAEYFSESDLEALDFAWNTFGHLTRWDISDFTHEYPEFKKHLPALRSGSKVEPINLEDFLKDPTKAEIDKCYELNEEERQLRQEYLSNLSHVSSLWR